MDDARLVSGAQGEAELLADVDGAHRLDGGVLLDGARQIDAVEELHHEVGRAVGQRSEVADVDDVLVADRRRALRLLAEAGDDLLVVRDLGTQDLDRQGLVQDRVLAR